MELTFDLKTGPVKLRAADTCYEICRLRTRTDKATGGTVEEWESYIYPTTLENALNRLMAMKVKASEARTLSELQSAIENARAEICHIYGTSIKEEAR